MTRCEEIQPLLYPWLDQELGVDRAALVSEHLRACPECGRRAAAERRFLDRIAEVGHETAPADLRARVERILAGEEAPPDRGPAVRPVRSRARRWLVPVAAAAAVALLVLRPWGADPPAARAASFAADYEAHAVLAPSGMPFPEGAPVPPPPELPGARVAGLSECVVDGRTYAHYTYRIGDRVVSVFLPMEDAVLPRSGVAGAGPTSVITVAAAAGTPAAVLVSGDFGPEELRTLWPGG